MKSKIIIFGASLKGRAALDLTNYIGKYEVHAFADNSPEKQKELFMELPVLSAAEAVASGMPIMLASMFKYEIIEQLKALGCTNYFLSYREKGIELAEEQIKELEDITSYIFYSNLYELLYDFEVRESHSNKTVEQDKVVFCCDTVYQFLSCFLLRKLYFKDKKCIILVGNRLESLNNVLKNMNVGIFDGVIHFEHNYNLKKSEFNEIIGKIGVPEKFIFFDDTYIITKKIMRLLPNNTMSIMADEGLYFYCELAGIQKANKTFDTMRVDEFWGYNESLFTSPKHNIPFREITFKEKAIKGLIEELNTLFGYTHRKIDGEIVYFDETMKGYISHEEEMQFFNRVENILKNYAAVIKPHPSEGINKYSSSIVPLLGGSLEASRFPWELYELNNVAEDVEDAYIYISLFSTASMFNYVFAPSLMRKNTKVIFVYKIFEVAIKEHLLNPYFKTFEKFIQKIPDANIFIPESFEELESLLDDMAGH